jgi:hypothetical protein
MPGAAEPRSVESFRKPKHLRETVKTCVFRTAPSSAEVDPGGRWELGRLKIPTMAGRIVQASLELVPETRS